MSLASTNYATGTYVAPFARLRGLGITPVVASLGVVDTNWHLLTLSATPTRRGQLTLEIQGESDAVGVTGGVPDSAVYYDGVFISYRTMQDLGDLDIGADGEPIKIPITQLQTPGQVWAEQTADNQEPNSFGKFFQDRLDVVLSTLEANIRGSDNDDLKNLSDEIATLENLSQAQAQTAATDALTAYDPPTKAEMDTMESNLSGLLSTLQTGMNIAKSLVFDNVLIDQTSHDGEDNMEGWRLRSYDTKANMEAALATSPAGGTTGLLYTFDGFSSFTGKLLDIFSLGRL
jgi:hypothetical protein